MCEKLSKEEFVEEMKRCKEEFVEDMKRSRAMPDPEAEAAKYEAWKAKQREYNRRYAERKKAEKAEAAGSLTMRLEDMPPMVSSFQIEPTCVLTKDEAYIVAEFIDDNLFDAIRNDADWDSLYALRNLIHAYEKMCMTSGFVGLTEPGKEENADEQSE